jgi:hypothetical protein
LSVERNRTRVATLSRQAIRSSDDDIFSTYHTASIQPTKGTHAAQVRKGQRIYLTERGRANGRVRTRVWYTLWVWCTLLRGTTRCAAQASNTKAYKDSASRLVAVAIMRL